MDQIVYPTKVVTLYYAKIVQIVHNALSVMWDMFYRMGNVLYVLFLFAKNAKLLINAKYAFQITQLMKIMVRKCACQTAKNLI